MVPSPLRRALVTCALAAALTLPSLAAGSSGTGAGASRVVAAAPAATGAPLFAAAWNWLRALWSDEFCAIGPGRSRCGVQAPSAGTDAGCILDPNGTTTCGTSSSGTPTVHRH
jgi:hypothetical protein